MSNNRTMERPVEGRKVSGVCLAVSNYFGIDVTVVRILWVLASLFFLGTGLILYIACIFIIPQVDDGPIEGEFKEK